MLQRTTGGSGEGCFSPEPTHSGNSSVFPWVGAVRLRKGMGCSGPSRKACALQGLAHGGEGGLGERTNDFFDLFNPGQ